MSRRFFEADVIGSKAPPSDQWGDLPLAAASLAVHEATEAGIQQAHEHADETWKSTAYAAIVTVARRQAKLTADSIWRQLEGSRPVTHEPSALGPLIRIAARKGIIKKSVGELVKSDLMNEKGEARRHREIQVWDSLILDVDKSAAA